MLLNKKISIVYFISQIKWQLVIISVFSITVGFLHLHPRLSDIVVPLGILSLIGTIVALLLAFRTAQSYERWWEARIVWGAIVNDSRTLVRELSSLLPAEKKDDITLFAERQIIFVHALGDSLRRLPFSSTVDAYLRSHAISATNIPNALLEQHSSQLKDLSKKGAVTEFRLIRLTEIISRLCDSMGKCERIKNTIFPRSYSILLHTLIYIFAFLLPFGLDHRHILVEIFLSILIPILFISIEKTAIIMQDPFENTPVDTPVTAIAQTIEINLRQSHGQSDILEKKQVSCIMKCN